MGDPWVEWAAACVATPSVSFADISPSRGEIDPRQAPRSNAVSEHADAKAGLRTMSALHPISPLAGEMSGRTEGGRSAEHTSELQSLMRISYPVFCLKKNTYHIHCLEEQQLRKDR